MRTCPNLNRGVRDFSIDEAVDRDDADFAYSVGESARYDFLIYDHVVDDDAVDEFGSSASSLKRSVYRALTCSIPAASSLSGNSKFW